MQKHFEIHFGTGEVHSSDGIDWSEVSDRTEVNYFGTRKIVHLCKHNISKIKIFHDGLEDEMVVPEGCQAFQATRSETVFLPNEQVNNRVIGKIMGIVKDGSVVEERFIDGLQHKILGLKL